VVESSLLTIRTAVRAVCHEMKIQFNFRRTSRQPHHLALESRQITKLLSLLILFGGLGTAAPQIIHLPGVVTFQNTETVRPPVTPATFHLIYDSFGMPLIGTQYRAELYYLDTDINVLLPIAATISPFRAAITSIPGAWVGPALPISLPDGYGGVDVIEGSGGLFEAGDGSGVGDGYYPVTMTVKVWDSMFGPTFESATGGFKGTTASFIYTRRFTGPVPSPFDTAMINQPGGFISIVPEPSVLVLSGVGMAALAFLRLRKSR